jgi:uncharacterized RDD family membrane protein YckC
MAITQLPASLLVQLSAATIAGTAIALLLAPAIADFLIRFRARRLPERLSERYLEEWLAEARSISNRFRKLTFAIAISVMRSRTLIDAEEGLPGLTAPAVVLSIEDVRVYSDFWYRFAALAIDSVLSIAVSALIVSALRPAMPDFVFSLLFGTTWLLVVSAYCVVRFGGSPGKLLLKLRIVTMDGEPLTYRHALLRVLPDYVLTTASVLMVAWAISQVDGAAFEGLSSRARSELVTATIPVWILWPIRLSQCAWGLGDIAVFVDSHERRALHDLIAGTVVVHKIPRVVGTLDGNPPAGSTSAYR